MPLKAKYLRPGRLLKRKWDRNDSGMEGTLIYTAQSKMARYKPRTNPASSKVKTLRARMKSYLGGVSR